jgi:nitrile hydratase beta subunit
MNGIHDLGGMHGFGRIDRDPDERGFHARWEAVVTAMQNAVTRGVINIDEFRHAIERMEPARYLGVTYFEKWLEGISRALVEKGAISADALEARTQFFEAHPDAPATAALSGAAPAAPASRPAPLVSFRRPASAPPRFASGDRVTTRNDHPVGHTRLPRYARGKRGTIAQDYGAQVFPDTHAHGLGECPQPLYRVAFEAHELWGESAEPNTVVHLDLWESYLLPRES